MLVKEIKSIATQRGINPQKMNKSELIRAIQAQEGNTPCFKSGRESCDQHDCCWRADCLQA